MENDQNTQSNQANSGQASSGQGGSGQGSSGPGSSSQSNQRTQQGSEGGQGNQDTQSTQGTKTRGSDIPGTSKDPIDRVISDGSPQESNRQDPNSDRGGSSTRESNSDSQKRS
jgi:hypothetical protein